MNIRESRNLEIIQIVRTSQSSIQSRESIENGHSGAEDKLSRGQIASIDGIF